MIECRGLNGLADIWKTVGVLRTSCFFNWDRVEVVGVVVIEWDSRLHRRGGLAHSSQRARESRVALFVSSDG